jgi:hypothetical protein
MFWTRRGTWSSRVCGRRWLVELTIALHRIFDSPRDRTLFDTGHQTYVHKILTGRHDEFPVNANRKERFLTLKWQIKSAAWAGLALVPLCIVSLPLASFSKPFPVWSDSPAEIADWFSGHRVQAIIQAYTVNLGAIGLIWLAVGIVMLCKASGRTSIFTEMIIPAGIMLEVLYLASNALWMVAALAGTPDHPKSDSLIKYSFEVTSLFVVTAYIMAAFMALSSGVAILSTCALPRWTAWTGFAVAIPLFIGGQAIPLINISWIEPMSWGHTATYILLYCWTTAVSIAMLRISPLDPVFQKSRRADVLSVGG